MKSDRNGERSWKGKDRKKNERRAKEQRMVRGNMGKGSRHNPLMHVLHKATSDVLRDHMSLT